MQNNSLIFNQLLLEDGKVRFKEINPEISNGYLEFRDGSVSWSVPSPVDSDGKLIGTDLFFEGERMGFGRKPLLTYKVDLKTEENKLETVLHIGDGKHGFSMGNGTSEGFIPEIIGMGADHDDAGLYFLGKTTDERESDIPLVVIGGFSPKGNRPILGVTAGNYNDYKFKIDNDGTVHAKNVQIIDSINMLELFEIIREQQERIDELTDRLNKLQQ